METFPNQEEETEFNQLWSDGLRYEKFPGVEFDNLLGYREVIYAVAVSNLRIKNSQDQIQESVDRLYDMVDRLADLLEVKK